MAIYYGDGSNSSSGRIIQVQSQTQDAYWTTTSSSFTDISGLSVSITPNESASKILVLWGVQYCSDNGGSRMAIRLLRGSSAIAIGQQRSARVQATGSSETAGGGGNMKCCSGQHLDSPSTTSATTYKFQAACIDGSIFKLNSSVNDSNISSYANVASFITVMEVAQ